MKKLALIAALAVLALAGCSEKKTAVPSKQTEIVLQTTPTPVTPKPSATPSVTPAPLAVISTPVPSTPEPKATPQVIMVPKIVVATPTPTPKSEVLYVVSNSIEDKPKMTKAGLDLIVYYEVGGEKAYRRNPYPEYSGEGSGVTWAIGYDAHQNKYVVIISDWTRLGETKAKRLAATQPYYGASAKVHVKDVKDIMVPWEDAIAVFVDVDVSRTDIQCQKAFPGFDDLRDTAKDAIRSLVFNRGASMAGPNRKEMRDIRDAVPKKDYTAMAKAERAMKRIWKGTSIEAGMNVRREAEAKLFETP